MIKHDLRKICDFIFYIFKRKIEGRRNWWSSLFYNMSARDKQHECDMSYTSAIQATLKGHDLTP